VIIIIYLLLSFIIIIIIIIRYEMWQNISNCYSNKESSTSWNTCF